MIASSESRRWAQEPRAGPPSASKETVGWLDLPNKDQLFVLSICRLSEPLSNVCLLPYIYYLVRSVLNGDNTTRESTTNGRDSDSSDTDTAAKVSAYSGILVAAFPLAQFLVSLPWGRLSDSHGRKFSIVIGIGVSVIANLAFGFSRSFGALLFWRTLAGLANGNVGIMRTMTAEIVKERKYQTKAFLLLPLVFNSGMVASLAFGGMLAEPVTSLPWLFGPDGLLNWSSGSDGVQWAVDYPYALPAMMNAGMLGFAFLLAVFWLRETLPGKEGERDVGVFVGRTVFDWVKRSVCGRKQAAYMPLSETEDLLFDPRQRSRARSSVELDGLMEDKTTAAVQVEDQQLRPQPPSPSNRKKPSLRASFTWRTVTAAVSSSLLPLHISAFMVGFSASQ